jgi:hypothetical protein
VKLKFRRSTVVLSVLGVLGTASVAFAAFTLYSGLTGGTNQNNFVTSAASGSAITVAQSGAASNDLDQGGQTTVPLTFTNNDPNNAHSINGSLVTYSDDNGGVCASHLTSDASSTGFNASIPAGGSIAGTLVVDADNSLPISCVGKHWSGSVSGTTS